MQYNTESVELTRIPQNSTEHFRKYSPIEPIISVVSQAKRMEKCSDISRLNHMLPKDLY